MGPFAERIASQLGEVGITVNLTPGPIATTLESYRAGTEQMGLWLWNPDYPDSADYLAFGPGGIVGLRAGVIVYDGPADKLTPEVLTTIYGEEDWTAAAARDDEDAGAPVVKLPVAV